MLSLTHLAKAGYLLAFAVAIFLLLSPSLTQAQFGVSGGYRGTPPLPTLAFPIISSGSGSAGGSGSSIFGGTGGSGFASGSFTTQIITINPSDFFPNGGRILTLPPPTLMPMLNNEFFAGFLFSPFTADSTGSFWSSLLALNAGGGLGISGMVGGGFGGVGAGGGIAGGGIAGGIGGGIAGGGFGQGGIGGFGQGGIGGMGGFAGKGMGGFNGKKPL